MGLRREGKQKEAREVLEDALERYEPTNSMTFWLAVTLAEIERDEQRWQACRELLDLAHESLDPPDREPTVASFAKARPWYLGIKGEYWIDLGLPDLAAPLFELERELVEAFDPPDPSLRRAAVDHELRLYLAEDDFDALQAAELRLEDEEWYRAEPEGWRAKMGVRFAAGRVEAELREVAPRGEARARLEDLLAGGALDAVEERWAHLHLALALLDEGNLDAAQEVLASLRGLLASEGGAEPSQPYHRLALALIALEARHALLSSGAGRTPAEPLTEHLARLESAWNDGFLARWAEAPVRSGGVGYLYLSYQHLVAQELVELRLHLNGPEACARAAISDLLRAQALGTLARQLDAGVPTLDQLREQVLPPGGGLLWWHVGRDRSYVFLVDHEGVACERLAPVHVLEESARVLVLAAQRARRSGRDDDLDAVPAAARAAADVLLPAGWRERIEGWRGARLVGLEGIGYLPFELLPATDGTPLGERLELGYLPSIPVGLALSQRAPAAPGVSGPDAVWIVADTLVRQPVLERWGLEALDLTEARLRPLASAAGGAHLVTGDEATSTALRRAAAAGARVLHVVAHGLLDLNRERPAGLLLAPEGDGSGELWAADVEEDGDDAPRYPPLVVLTACGTARGPLRRGDDGRGDLGAAFLLRGADAVVLSAAAQELNAGLRIAETLHEGLARGDSPAAALLALRRDLAARGARVDALQAGLVHALGDTHRPVFARVEPVPAATGTGPWRTVLVTVLALLVLGAVLLIAARLRRAA